MDSSCIPPASATVKPDCEPAQSIALQYSVVSETIVPCISGAPYSSAKKKSIQPIFVLAYIRTPLVPKPANHYYFIYPTLLRRSTGRYGPHYNAKGAGSIFVAYSHKLQWSPSHGSSSSYMRRLAKALQPFCSG